MNLKQTYGRITLLSFDENILEKIEGKIISGTLNVNGQSPIRRTINITFIMKNNINTFSSVDNFSLNKKIKVEIGTKEILNNIITWHNCGIFIISSVNKSISLTNSTISIQGKDKMVLLDGSVGGTIPALTVFHEARFKDENNLERVKEVLIYNIIKEAVHHFGKEKLANIEINDVPQEAKKLIRYIGNRPIYFSPNFTSIVLRPPPSSTNTYLKYLPNDDIGYEKTKFTYPGELILNAGETVVSLLNKICQVLGNFEFFYNVDGKFIFQEKRNYLRRGQSPTSSEEYFYLYDKKEYYKNLILLKNISSINFTPKYENIKNEFIVWGEKRISNSTYKIRYHLVIDKKPEKFYWDRYIYENTDGNIISDTTRPKKGKILAESLADKETIPYDWREELYRRALIEWGNPEEYYYPYFSEIKEEWRKVFNPGESEWENNGYYNLKNNLMYWLEFMDPDEFSILQGYSVRDIGWRTKVVNDTEIENIFNKRVPDLEFHCLTEENVETLEEGVFQVPQAYKKYFTNSWTKPSAFDKIKELLFQNLTYNTQVSISCLPIYDLNPNSIIQVEGLDQKNYEVLSFSLPLSYNGLMNISAIQAQIREEINL